MHCLLRDAIDAVVPVDAATALRRSRNVAFTAALLTALAPRDLSLGTASQQARWTSVAAWGVVFVLSIAVRKRTGRTIRATILATSVAAATFVCAQSGLAAWPFGLAAILALPVVLAVGRAASGAKEWAPSMPLHSGWRTVAGFGAAFIPVMILREFVVLPIHVPTGSMKPTIVSLEPSEHQASGFFGGHDHILVDRFAYLVRDPRRWEIAVFEHPLQRSVNYVKRIVGLPGESIEIRDGDLWVDGRVARKPVLVQESLWKPLHPPPGASAKTADVTRAFLPGDGGREASRWSRDGEFIRCKAPAGDPSWYVSNRSYTCPDLRVGAVVHPEAGASVHLRITTRGRNVELSLPGPGASFEGSLDVEGDPPQSVATRIEGGERVELSTAEGLVRVTVNGREIATAEVAVTSQAGGAPNRNSCALGASSGTVRLGAIRVDEDVSYVATGSSSVSVPAGSYFALGDNSPFSEDSRKWRVVEFAVPGSAAPLRAAMQAIDESGNRSGNIRQQDGQWTFQDVDGVPRSVPVATVRRTEVAAPFVPRDHMVGRAVLVIWPWAPGRYGFRPRILP